MTPEKTYDYILKELLQDKYEQIVKKPLYEYNSLHKTYINEVFNQHLQPLLEVFIHKYDIKKENISIEYIPFDRLDITINFNDIDGRYNFDNTYTLYHLIQGIEKYTGFKINDTTDNIEEIKFTIKDDKINYLSDVLRSRFLEKLKSMQKPKNVNSTVWQTQYDKVRNEV